MPKKTRLYGQLFLSALQLSAFTFGGGYVMIPLMRRKFVDQLHWIDEEEMLDFAAIAQSSPGAMAVNAALLVGYRMAGIPGAMVTLLGTVLPPLAILSLISLFYQAFRDNVVVSRVMRGMQAGVAAVIADVVFTMGRGVLAEKRALGAVLIVLAFAAAYFLRVNVVIVLLACGAVGALDGWLAYRKRRKEGEA